MDTLNYPFILGVTQPPIDLGELSKSEFPQTIGFPFSKIINHLGTDLGSMTLNTTKNITGGFLTNSYINHQFYHHITTTLHPFKIRCLYLHGCTKFRNLQRNQQLLPLHLPCFLLHLAKFGTLGSNGAGRWLRYQNKIYQNVIQMIRNGKCHPHEIQIFIMPSAN